MNRIPLTLAALSLNLFAVACGAPAQITLENSNVAVEGVTPGTEVAVSALLADGTTVEEKHIADGQGRITVRAAGAREVTVVADGTVVAHAMLDRNVVVDGFTAGRDADDVPPCGLPAPRPPLGGPGGL